MVGDKTTNSASGEEDDDDDEAGETSSTSSPDLGKIGPTLVGAANLELEHSTSESKQNHETSQADADEDEQVIHDHSACLQQLENINRTNSSDCTIDDKMSIGELDVDTDICPKSDSEADNECGSKGMVENGDLEESKGKENIEHSENDLSMSECEGVKKVIVEEENETPKRKQSKDKHNSDYKWLLSTNHSSVTLPESTERPETPPLQKLMRQDFSPLRTESMYSPSPPKKMRDMREKEGFTSKLASVIVPSTTFTQRTASHPKQLMSHATNVKTSNVKSLNLSKFHSSNLYKSSNSYPIPKTFLQTTSSDQPLDLSIKTSKDTTSNSQLNKGNSFVRHKSSSSSKHSNGFSSPLSTSLQSLQQKFGGDFHLRGLRKPANHMLFGPEIPAIHQALLHSSTMSLPHVPMSLPTAVNRPSVTEHSPINRQHNSTPSPHKSKADSGNRIIKPEHPATPEKSIKLEKSEIIEKVDGDISESDDLEANGDKYTNHMCTCGKWFNNLYSLSLHLQESGHLPARSKAVSLLEYPKLVRGQDMWLNQESEQTRRILRCIQCGESFRTLPMLTVHMMKTQHYTKIVSSEHARRAHKCSAYCDREPDKECVFKCKVCQDTFTDMEGLANHMIMSGHHKKQTPRPQQGYSSDMYRQSQKRKRYYNFEESLNPFVNPTVAAMLDYKQKCLTGQLSPDISVESDDIDSTITCENCGKQIETKGFVEHVRACLGEKLKDNGKHTSSKDDTTETEKSPDYFKKSDTLQNENPGTSSELQEKSHKMNQSPEPHKIKQELKEPESPNRKEDECENEKQYVDVRRQKLKRHLFEETNETSPKNTKYSTVVKAIDDSSIKSETDNEIHDRSSSKGLPSPKQSKNDTFTKDVSDSKYKTSEENGNSMIFPDPCSDTGKMYKLSKKLDIIDPELAKDESSSGSAISAMESFIQKSFSNKFDYKKGNIIITPRSSSDGTFHPRQLPSEGGPEETTSEYLNKYREFYSALSTQNGYGKEKYLKLKDADTPNQNSYKRKNLADKKDWPPELDHVSLNSPNLNAESDCDSTGRDSVKSNQSAAASSLDKNENLEKKYLNLKQPGEEKSEKEKSSALDSLSSFVYGQPMTSEHPLDSLQRLITKSDIPKLIASGGARAFRYLPPHLQLHHASLDLPMPLNLSVKEPGEESDDEGSLRHDDEVLSDFDGAASPANSDGEPVEYRCTACSRKFASKGSYRYHLSRCHLSSVKRYGIKEAFSMSPYVYLPLDHTAKFSKYYEMAKELASRKK